MTDSELYAALVDRHGSGEELLSRLKTAGVRDFVRHYGGKAGEYLKEHKHELVGGALGAGALAGVGAGVSYAASKRDQKTGKSAEERATEKLVGTLEANKSEKPGWAEREANIYARAAKDLAKVYGDHPGAAAGHGALLAAPLGWKWGKPIGKAVGEELRLIKAERAAQAVWDASKTASTMNSGLRSLPKPSMPSMKPTAPTIPNPLKLPKVAMAEEWGRERAKEAAISLKKSKQSAITKEADMATTLASWGSRAGKAMTGLGQRAIPMLNKYGPQVGGALKSVAKAPVGQRLGYGAAAGAAAGTLRHMTSRRDPVTGQKRTSLLGSMAGGAAMGAGAGLAAPGFVGQVQNNRHISDFMQGRLGTRPAPMGAKQMNLPFGPRAA